MSVDRVEDPPSLLGKCWDTAMTQPGVFSYDDDHPGAQNLTPDDLASVRETDSLNDTRTDAAASDGPTSGTPDSPADRLIQDLGESLQGRGWHASQINVVRSDLRALLMFGNYQLSAQPSTGEFTADNVIGDYHLGDVLGRGGGGMVYAAHHMPTGDQVALKTVPVSDNTSRFRREMELVLQLAHPHIVTAREVGQHGAWYYIAMEQLCGPDLRAWVRDDGPMSAEQTVSMIRGAASALHHAHLRGLTHRDVKPGNLMMAADGRIKLMDLGLATDAGSSVAAERSFHTRHEAVGGTPGYMAPEQACSLAEADARSDVYSLAATWFYLLTGRSMVGGTTWTKRLNHLINGTEIETLDETQLPEPLLSLWRRMIARDPADRPQTMLDVLNDLPDRPVENPGPAEAIDVLIVEDNQDDLYVTIESLKRFNHGVNIQSAGTLSEAVASAGASKPDVVLLDLQLPDSNGIETVQAFVNAVPDVALIVLSGNADDQVADQCRSIGAIEFVVKHSLSVHELERVIFVTLSRSAT